MKSRIEDVTKRMRDETDSQGPCGRLAVVGPQSCRSSTTGLEACSATDAHHSFMAQHISPTTIALPLWLAVCALHTTNFVRACRLARLCRR